MSRASRRTAAVAAGLVITASGVWSATASAADPGTAPYERVPRDRVAAECGMDPALLEQVTPRLTDTPFVIVRYGKLCWEGGYPGGTTDPYSVYSITKTMGGLLTGMVDARSALSDQDPVTRWIAPEDMGAINPKAKIAHVLAMASTNEDLSPGKKEKWTYDLSGDREISRLVKVMDKVIAREPQNFAGSADAREFAQRELFDALGMKASSWPGGSIGGNMRSSVRDMARMGELILQRGRYNGRQLIDEEFAYKMTHPSFEDSNTGFGYLTYANAADNWGYSTGTNDTRCSPYTRWPSYPHGPFFEAKDSNGGFPGEQKHDVGLVWAAGAGGQKLSVHRGLDMVIVVRDDSVSVGESETVGSFEGHKNVWNAIRPALVALDPVYRGNEAGFCAAYQRSEHAPDLLEPWFEPAPDRSGPPAGAPPAAGARPSPVAPAPAAPPAAPSCQPSGGFDAFSVRGTRGGSLRVRVTRRQARRFTFDLLRQGTERGGIGDRLVARRASSRDSFSVRPGRGVRDGFYLARVRMTLAGGPADVRRVYLRREDGRFRVRPDAFLRGSCGILASFKLERSVFGGRAGRALGISYRLAQDAERVTVRVLGRGGRALRATGTRSGRTYRLRLGARGIRRGRDVRVRIAVTRGGVTTTETLTARRL